MFIQSHPARLFLPTCERVEGRGQRIERPTLGICVHGARHTQGPPRRVAKRSIPSRWSSSGCTSVLTKGWSCHRPNSTPSHSKRVSAPSSRRCHVHDVLNQRPKTWSITYSCRGDGSRALRSTHGTCGAESAIQPFQHEVQLAHELLGGLSISIKRPWGERPLFEQPISQGLEGRWRLGTAAIVLPPPALSILWSLAGPHTAFPKNRLPSAHLRCRSTPTALHAPL